MPRNLDAIVTAAIEEARKQGLFEGKPDADIRKAGEGVKDLFDRIFPSQETEAVRARDLARFDEMMALANGDPFFSSLAQALAPFRQEIASNTTAIGRMSIFGNMARAVERAVIALPYEREHHEVLAKILAFIDFVPIPTLEALSSSKRDLDESLYKPPPSSPPWSFWQPDRMKITKVHAWGVVFNGDPDSREAGKRGQVLQRAVVDVNF